MKSLYKTEEGKKEIINLYNEKLNDLNINYTSRNLDTSYGKTNCIIIGDSSKPPILVIHGSNGCAPIAIESYPNLSEKFQVFAIDVLAQPNKSAETRLSMKDNSYGIWLNSIITNLQLKNVTLVGFSFGGLIILKTLLHNENNIKSVYLAAPAFIVNGNPLVSLFKVFFPMKKYMKSKNLKYVEKFVSALFTERDPFALRYLSKVLLYFNMDFSPVPIIKKKEALSIQTPITLFAAKKDIMFPGQKMIKRAQQIFPSLKQSIMLENSKHVQSKIDNKKIETQIMNDLTD